MFVKYSMSDSETFSFNHKAHFCNLKELSRLLIESFLYELQGYQKGTHPQNCTFGYSFFILFF